MKRHIPNTITCCNLLCGCFATYYAFSAAQDGLYGTFAYALLLIIGGAVFDFFDGFMARLLHVSSPIGKELDSLADDITFGLAPATIVFALLRNLMPHQGLYEVLSLSAFLIAAFSALRLAKFNLDERQSLGFIGLPTPANALFWGALSLSVMSHSKIVAQYGEYIFYAVLVGVVFSCWILVSEVPMFALKFKHFGWKGNEVRYSFIAVSALLLALLGWSGFSAIIVLYVIVSAITQRKS